MTGDDTVPDSPMGVSRPHRDNSWVPCSIALDVNGNCAGNCSQRCERKLRMTSNRKNNIINDKKAIGRGLPGPTLPHTWQVGRPGRA